jgi:capsular polysaccharide biosynthesis protein
VQPTNGVRGDAHTRAPGRIDDDMDERVEVGQAAHAVRRRWALVIVLVLVGAAAGWLRYATAGQMYEAKTSILVGPSLRWSSLTQDDVSVSQDLAHVYGDLAQRQPVLQPIVRDLDLPWTWQQLRGHIRVSFPSDAPQVLQITVRAPTAERAGAVAAALGQQLTAIAPGESQREAAARNFAWGQLQTVQADILKAQERLRRLQTQASVNGSFAPGVAAAQQALISEQQMYSSLLNVLANHPPTNRLEILEPAPATGAPVHPDPLRDVGAGAVAGLVLALMLAYILEFRRRRSRVAAERVPELPMPPSREARSDDEDNVVDRRRASFGEIRAERRRRGSGLA